MLGKIYLFLTSSKTNGRVPTQQGAPTTCNLTFREVSEQIHLGRQNSDHDKPVRVRRILSRPGSVKT